MTRSTRPPISLARTLPLAAAVVLGCGEEPAPSVDGLGAEYGLTPAEAARLEESLKDHHWPEAGAKRLRWMIEHDERIQNFLFNWAVNPEGVFANRWFGIPTVQNPLDVWITQEILFEVKPDFVVEAGTLEGGSAAMWAMLLEHINPEGRVITIDVQNLVTAARELPIVQRRVDFLRGSSTDPRIVAEVAKRVGEGTVVVILDSLHTEEHVRAELEAYAPLVSVGSYLIVQDTGTMAGLRYIPQQESYPGAGRAVEAFLAENDDFEIDESRERWVLSFNGNGFLKRVR